MEFLRKMFSYKVLPAPEDICLPLICANCESVEYSVTPELISALLVSFCLNYETSVCLRNLVKVLIFLPFRDI